MRLTINLATRYYVDSRRFALSVMAVLLPLLLFLAVNLSAIADNSGQMSRLEGALGGLDKERPGHQSVAPGDYDALIARIRFANAVIDQKSRNWLLLLDRLEGVMPDGVSLSAIEVNPRESNADKAALKLQAQAKNFSDMRQFVEQLEKSTFFSDVFLVNQRDVKVGATQKGLDFDVTCKVMSR